MSRLQVPKFDGQVEQMSSREAAAQPTPECKTIWKPKSGWLIAVRSKVGDVSKGGIFLPDSAKLRRSLSEGHVVRSGSSAFEHGDYIAWEENQAYDMEDEGFKFVLLPESAVLLHC